MRKIIFSQNKLNPITSGIKKGIIWETVLIIPVYKYPL